MSKDVKPLNVMPVEAMICRSYTFEAAHHLPGLPDGHKCKRLHGHSYRVEVRLSGPVDERGLVRGVEFGELDVIMDDAIIRHCDHHCWNDKLEDPTVEHIASYIAHLLCGALDVPLTVRVYEGPRSWAQVSAQ